MSVVLKPITLVCDTLTCNHIIVTRSHTSRVAVGASPGAPSSPNRPFGQLRARTTDGAQVTRLGVAAALGCVHPPASEVGHGPALALRVTPRTGDPLPANILTGDGQPARGTVAFRRSYGK